MKAAAGMEATVQALLESLPTLAPGEESRAWAQACARALGLGGVAISLGGELVWFTDSTSASLEDLQFVLGEGPSQGRRGGTEVREVPDVSRMLSQQWPQFPVEAEELGVAAMFVWPIRIGAVQVGTMTGYRRSVGPLTPQQSAQGWLVADALAQHVLAHWPAGPNGRDGSGHVGAVDLHRAEVHQATGVLSERLGVPLDEALARLRAEAYSGGRTLAEVAHAVIVRELPHDGS